MIDTIKEARLVVKKTEKYLSDILAHEWMHHHPHFHGNSKETMNGIVNNLIGTNHQLNLLIGKLKKDIKNDNI
tara:strand:- start:2314 stop:2532 length:219 start_codon:yes stop_codon:yes gene_type:complete